MKIEVDTNYMWEDLPDADRFELILELIKSSPEPQWFRVKIIKKIKDLELD
jgi:hypothetical protein